MQERYGIGVGQNTTPGFLGKTRTSPQEKENEHDPHQRLNKRHSKPRFGWIGAVW